MFTTKVQTTEGPILGFIDPKHKVLTWQGVPFAARAIGEYRWRKPQPAVKHQEQLDCTEFAPINMQIMNGQIVGEEGILTMDIYRPNNADKNLPILVYFHGGNNQTQSSRIWQGGLIANQANIIFVSVQSRLSILGYNCLPALKRGEDPYEDNGSFGLLDEAASLDWIKANALAFGGNPEDVTVTGISSGGRNIMAMLTSPLFAGKFQKAIPLSGGCTIADEKASQLVFATQLAKLVVEDGIKSDLQSAKAWLLQPLLEVREYLLGIKAERMAPIMSGACIRMHVFPHLYGDGALLPKEGFATKTLNEVPLLLLASTDEFSLYLNRHEFFAARLADLADENSVTFKEFAFANKYGSILNYYFNTHESGENLYAHYKAPIYVGRANYGHNPEIVGSRFAMQIGACHGNIMPLVTDQENPLSFFNLEDKYDWPGALELRSIFIDMLSAFIHTGSPQTDALPVWEQWTPEARPEMIFDANHDQAIITADHSSFDRETFYAEVDADTTISEESKHYIIHNVLNARWFSSPLEKHYGVASSWPQE